MSLQNEQPNNHSSRRRIPPDHDRTCKYIERFDFFLILVQDLVALLVPLVFFSLSVFVQNL
jgi:hypothetical protein